MWRIYKHYYQFLFAYPVWFGFFWLFLSILVVIQSIQPYFNKLFVDNILVQNFDLLWKIILLYVAIRIFELLFDILTYWFGDHVLLPASRDARLKVLSKIQDLDFAYHLSKSTGSLISAMKRGDSSFFQLFHDLNIQMYRVVLSFAVMLAFFINLGWTIAGIMLLTFVINLGFIYFLLRYNLKVRTEFNDAEDSISAIIVDNLLNFETVKLFAKEKAEINRLDNEFKDWLAKLWAYANSFRLMDLLVGLVGNFGLFMVLVLGWYWLINQEISPGEYVMLVSFVAAFYPRFFEFMYHLRNIAKHNIDLKKYLTILDKTPNVLDPKKPLSLTKVAGEIEFRNVNFSYPQGKQDALINFNLKIKAGESVALVGHSGAGKTTVNKLLLRFYDPDSGQILLDGVNIRDLTKSHLRSFIGVVPQDPIMFNNTIAYNVSYGVDRDVSSLDLKNAAKTANLDEFIYNLPKQFETNVGERGVKLSGGQKQRLAIARMVLADPEIIIFDEATSQLDSESERKIQDAFWKVAKNKTTIIIAHRLSTVVKADRIVVMKDGEIKEIGTHQELYNRADSLYRYFWSLQQQGKDVNQRL